MGRQRAVVRVRVRSSESQAAARGGAEIHISFETAPEEVGGIYYSRFSFDFAPSKPEKKCGINPNSQFRTFATFAAGSIFQSDPSLQLRGRGNVIIVYNPPSRATELPVLKVLCPAGRPTSHF